MNYVALREVTRFFTPEHVHVYCMLSSYYLCCQKENNPHYLTFGEVSSKCEKYGMRISKTFLFSKCDYKHFEMCSIAKKHGYIALLELFYYYTHVENTDDIAIFFEPTNIFTHFFQHLSISDFYFSLTYGHAAQLSFFYSRYLSSSYFTSLMLSFRFEAFLDASSLGCFQAIETFRACVTLHTFTEAFLYKNYLAICSALLNGHTEVLKTFKRHLIPDLFQAAVRSEHCYRVLFTAIENNIVAPLDSLRHVAPETFLHHFKKQKYWIFNYACRGKYTDIINYFTQHISKETMSRAWHALQIDN